ncbi:hypothetical protein [Xanthomonas sp. XNM01]|jgi:hypothetical protein|uniref:hypothetical protein n=1 Tax=Xanthomonas sp. XNM01 TaxID=2769289 RepID=UPI00177C3E31|nr:hypothetical protein [Xanthomonas sp. XNM01]MBD9369731.1 hypothetical protein [Xanthomonas sp. XNM01]
MSSSDTTVQEETIFRIASWLVPQAQAVSAWYDDDAIDRLGGLTARELVGHGRGGEVVDFLLEALSSEMLQARDF